LLAGWRSSTKATARWFHLALVLTLTLSVLFSVGAESWFELSPHAARASAVASIGAPMKVHVLLTMASSGSWWFTEDHDKWGGNATFRLT
jgi:hypothetical protein